MIFDMAPEGSRLDSGELEDSIGRLCRPPLADHMSELHDGLNAVFGHTRLKQVGMQRLSRDGSIIHGLAEDLGESFHPLLSREPEKPRTVDTLAESSGL